MRRTTILALLALALMAAAPASAQSKPEGKDAPVLALVGATLIDGNGGTPVPDAVVLIQGKTILKAGPASAVKVPEKAETIDVRGKFILPGFIDCHIHITFPSNATELYTDDDAAITLRALHFMNLYLKSGVTAVRDVGGHVPTLQALAAAQAQGYIDSIRLFACGDLITTTGGHGDGYKGTLAADGPWEWRKAVRRMAKAGFGHIKISPPYTLEEAQAAVEEARMQGLRITSHGGGQSDTTPTTMTRIAVQAGVQCIEHLNEMEDDVLDLMAAKGVYNVPTLSVYRAQYRAGVVPRVLTEKRHWTQALHETLFRKARQRKILMGVGTDFTLSFMSRYPGCYVEEMKYFVELGMSPMEAIVAATHNGAVILDKQDQIGTVEAGKRADLQVIGGDPLKSFDALGHPEIVVMDGKIHRF